MEDGEHFVLSWLSVKGAGLERFFWSEFWCFELVSCEGARYVFSSMGFRFLVFLLWGSASDVSSFLHKGDLLGILRTLGFGLCKCSDHVKLANGGRVLSIGMEFALRVIFLLQEELFLLQGRFLG